MKHVRSRLIAAIFSIFTEPQTEDSHNLSTGCKASAMVKVVSALLPRSDCCLYAGAMYLGRNVRGLSGASEHWPRREVPVAFGIFWRTSEDIRRTAQPASASASLACWRGLIVCVFCDTLVSLL